MQHGANSSNIAQRTARSSSSCYRRTYSRWKWSLLPHLLLASHSKETPLVCRDHLPSMTTRGFDGVADDGMTTDLAPVLAEDAKETGNGSRNGGPSSRKYALRDDETPNKLAPCEAMQKVELKGAAAAEKVASDRSEIKGHEGSFHGVPDAQESKRTKEQGGDDDEEEDCANEQYQLVKKSIYKPPKKGSILQRLAGLSGGGSKAKCTIPPRDQDSTLVTRPDWPCDERDGCGISGASSNEGSRLEDVDLSESTDVDATTSAILVEEEEIEPIDVSIDRSLGQRRADQPPQEARDLPSPVNLPQHQQHDQGEAHEYQEDPFSMEATALQQTPQVVIHSGESDSETGFATLNPVIATRHKLHGPARLATVVSADATPCLVEIPSTTLSGGHASGSAAVVAPSSLLVINALGASGLLKVEKFGAQSTLLELQLCSRNPPSRVRDHTSQPSVMRTCLHKKGGSEAQWNQQFTAALESKQEQFIRATVKTNNRMIVGEAEVPLDKIGDLFYDQHYPLYRPDEGATEDAGQLPQDTSNEPKLGSPAGYVHLQLKIVDTGTGQTSPVAVPRLHLPFPTTSEPVPASLALQNSPAKRDIPRDLGNGSLLYKVPYHKSSVVGYTVIPRRVWVSVVESDGGERLITWASPTASTSSTIKKGSSGARTLSLALVTEIREGHNTKAFEAHKASNIVKEKEKCFSLVSKNRTLDLVAASKEEAMIWVAGLRVLLFPATAATYSDASVTSARMIHDYRQVALSSGRPNAVAEAVTVDPVKKKQQLAVWRSQIFDFARRNHIDAIASCLHDGCPIDLLETGTGDTLLIIACRVGSAPLVELCLSWRAKNDPHPEFGDTALQVAVAHHHADCLKLLLLTAAKSDMDSEIVNHIDSNSDAPLHVAARNGDFACLQHLLLHGADICVVDDIGRTPLHCAVSTAQQGGANCVAYLLDVGSDSVLNLGDHEGDTPLHYAALAGNKGAVKVLLESAADALAVNSNGETPFDVAVREHHQGCADLIAPYCTNSLDGNLSEESMSDRVPAGADINRGELHRDLSEEKREEENATRQQRRQRQHHRRHVREMDESNSEDDNEGVFGSSSDHDAEYDSSGYSSARYESPSRDLPNAYLQRLWSATDRAYDPGQDDQRQQRYFESSSGWLDSPRQGISTLSPSEQVRAVLARHQRSFSAVAGGGRPPMSARSAFDGAPKRNMSLSASSSLHYYPATAREWSPPRSEQQLLYWVNGRQVATERLDGVDVDWAAADHPKQGPYHLQPQDNGGGYRTGQGFDPVAYRGNSSRARSRSEDTPGPTWCYGSDTQAWCDRGNRSTCGAGNYSTNRATPTSTWGTEACAYTPTRQDQWARRPATAGSVPSASLWDLLYTEHGYPYYVNRQTGVSQWEKPPDAEIAPPLTHTIRSTTNSTRGPDEIVRMRLAQARRQQSMPAAAIRAPQVVLSGMEAMQRDDEAGSSNSICSASAIAVTPMGSAELVEASVPSGIAANVGATGDDPDAVPIAAVDSSGTVPANVPSTPGSLQSTYENRTGLRLSIDISSPPSKEHVRPAFVPSPRSKHGATPTNSEQTTADGTSKTSKTEDGSFQKSRASSPRGRSKNVNLIELKRANNLAIALASFKIHDRYEQIVDGVITMDETIISAPLLACLQRYFPTEQERDALQRFRGDVNTLGKPERFFYLLFQVPSVQTRIEMFLYKLEFGRMKQTLLSRILVAKRACRDLAENFAFIQAIDRFFSKQHHQQRSLAVLDQNRDVFKLKFLAEADEKLASFRGDLEKASSVDFTDLQLQLNRLLAGRRTIQSFVDQRRTVMVSDAKDMSDFLERFLLETRKSVADIEDEFESMEQWSDKLLAVFGENKATCRLADIVESILRLI